MSGEIHQGLRNIDLNLLVAFDLLMTECSVTRAADILCLSQSAMSHILNRLRRTLDDPILIRTEEGMKPTAFALGLQQPIRGALGQIHQALTQGEVFDPASSEVSFVIYAPEYFEMVFLPLLLERCYDRAPNISFRVEVMPENIPEKGLTNNEIDFVVGLEHYFDVPSRLSSEKLLEENLVCIVRRDNSMVGEVIDLEQYMTLQHVFPYPIVTAQSQLDDWLAQRGLSRKIAVMSQSYISAVSIIAKTDYVMTIPSRVAESLCQGFNLRIVAAPKDFPKTEFNLIWHPLYERNSSKQWLKHEILAVARSLGQPQKKDDR